MSKIYYTTGEVADLCHVSVTTIFRAVTNNHLKAHTTPGGHFRIAKEDVLEFLKKNRLSTEEEENNTKKILIVENNPAELRMFQRALESETNFTIRGTESGYQAGFITQSFKPDLILLDVFLDDIDGREVAKLIRSDSGFDHTKIVIITGAKNPTDLKTIKSLGLDGIIQKPISPSALREKIKELLA